MILMILCLVQNYLHDSRLYNDSENKIADKQIQINDNLIKLDNHNDATNKTSISSSSKLDSELWRELCSMIQLRDKIWM